MRRIMFNIFAHDHLVHWHLCFCEKLNPNDNMRYVADGFNSDCHYVDFVFQRRGRGSFESSYVIVGIPNVAAHYEALYDWLNL